MWLAEGLVTPLPEQNMAYEDLAEKYFKELINRGLIEVARQIRWKPKNSSYAR